MKWLMGLHKAWVWLSRDVGLRGNRKFSLVKKQYSVTYGLCAGVPISEDLPRDLLKPSSSLN